MSSVDSRGPVPESAKRTHDPDPVQSHKRQRTEIEYSDTDHVIPEMKTVLLKSQPRVEYANLNRQRDSSTPSSVRSGRNAKMTVHFSHLETRLIEYIHDHNVKYIVGCVAWITNFRIMEALASKAGCMFIVQSEEFGGENSGSGYITRLKKAYDDITPLPLLGGEYDDTLCDVVPAYNILKDTSKLAHPYAIRCAGIDRQSGAANAETNPKMHNKFAVFLNDQGIPISVWTGSFNWSNCGTKSYENALYIQDQNIVQSYFLEFVQILLQSKELAWKQ
jgi:hypothetical protein